MDARDLLEQKSYTPPKVQEVTITKSAVDRLVQLGYTKVEFSVEGGGCSGMNYKMNKLERELEDDDKIIKKENFELIVPFSSYIYLLGTEIDFSDDLLNGGFKFSNPQANRTCGCGTSFSV